MAQPVNSTKESNRYVYADIIAGQAAPSKIYLEETVDNILYTGVADLGSATSSPVWQIKRTRTVGQNIEIQFAGGGEYAYVWDDRATYFSDIFPPTMPVSPFAKLFEVKTAATPGVPYDLIDYEVPPNKYLKIRSAYGTSDCDCLFELLINGDSYQTKRNHHIKPDVDLYPGIDLQLIAGDILQTRVTNRSQRGTLSEITTYIYVEIINL